MEPPQVPRGDYVLGFCVSAAKNGLLSFVFMTRVRPISVPLVAVPLMARHKAGSFFAAAGIASFAFQFSVYRLIIALIVFYFRLGFLFRPGTPISAAHSEMKIQLHLSGSLPSHPVHGFLRKI